MKLFKKKVGRGVGRYVAKVKSLRSRPNSPSPSARSAASGTVDDLDVRRATSVSSHRSSLAGAGEGESLPSHPLKSGGTSNARPRSTPPSQIIIPHIVINNGLPGEDGEISNQKEDPGPQPPNQEWVSHSFHHYLN